MQIGAVHVAANRALGAVDAVVAAPEQHTAQRLLALAAHRATRVVLAPDDVAEPRGDDHGTDHAVLASRGGHVENAQTGQATPRHRREVTPEQLVHAAHHEHRHSRVGQPRQAWPDGRQVVLHPGLARVLAAATDDKVCDLRKLLAGVMRHHVDVVPVPLRPDRQRMHIAEIAVDAHLTRVQVHQRQTALARPGVDSDPAHTDTSPCSSPKSGRSYCAASLLRSCIIAV